MTGFSKMEGFFPSFPTIVSPSFRSWGRPRRRVKTLRSVGGWIYWQFGSRCLFWREKIPWRLRQMLSKTQRLYIHDIVCIYIYVCRIYVYIHIYINVCIVFLYIYIYTNHNVPFSHSFGRTQKYKEKDCWAIVSSIYKRSKPPQKKKNIRQEWGPSGDFYHAWWKPSVPGVLPVSRGSTTTKISLMQNLYIFYICWTTILKDMCTYVYIYICISI